MANTTKRPANNRVGTKPKAAPLRVVPKPPPAAPSVAPLPPPPPLRAESVAVASLRPHPQNYRTHTADQLAHLQQSIRQHGFYRNVVIAKDGTILAGHGVVEAARALGLSRVPVYRVDVAPDDPRALKILIGDNQIAQLAEVNDRALTDMLRDLKDRGDIGALLGTGYNEEQLALLLMVTRPAHEIADHDAAAEWVGMPAFDNALPVIANVYCATADDRDAFFAAIGATEANITRREKGASITWPLTVKRQRPTQAFVQDGSDDGAGEVSDLHPQQRPDRVGADRDAAGPRRRPVPAGGRSARSEGVSRKVRR